MFNNNLNFGEIIPREFHALILHCIYIYKQAGELSTPNITENETHVHFAAIYVQIQLH